MQVLQERGLGCGTVGIERDGRVLTTFEEPQKGLTNAQFEATDRLFYIARMVKEPEEIALIKESVQIAYAGLEAGTKAGAVGALGGEVPKRAVELEMKRRGAIREVEMEKSLPSVAPAQSGCSHFDNMSCGRSGGICRRSKAVAVRLGWPGPWSTWALTQVV